MVGITKKMRFLITHKNKLKIKYLYSIITVALKKNTHS